MVLSNKQTDAIAQIKTIVGQIGVRWFIKEELINITLHTMKALVQKGYLETLSLGSHTYYRYRDDGEFDISPRCNACNKILIGEFPENDVIKTEDLQSGKKYAFHKFVGENKGCVIEEIQSYVKE